MDNFNDLLLKFKEHLKVKNYSPMTVTAYILHLSQFLSFLKEKGIPEAKRVNRETINAYQLMLIEHRDEKGRGYTPATISLKIRAVKRLFEYLEETGHILINPAEYLKEPKQGKRLPRVVLSESEVEKILDRPNLSTMTGIRDRTILEVLYSTGIRLDELIKLSIYDCDLQGGLLRVNKGKGAKDRVVPLGRHAVRFLREYIAKVRPELTKRGEKNRTLFVTEFGKPISGQSVEKMVSNFAKEAGIKKRVSPHVFRHTFATGLVRNGADIVSVQRMLGHARLDATQIYTRVAGTEIKKTHREKHPRERERKRQCSHT